METNTSITSLAFRFAFSLSVAVGAISILALIVHYPPSVSEITNGRDDPNILVQERSSCNFLNKHLMQCLPPELQNGLGRTPDTTVIILNWSRLPNVIHIISIICKHLLHDTVASVVVWNNNPRALSNEDFLAADCPDGRVRIYNSPVNLYFQARFMACAEASTPYCFIQDDDYLIWPEIIQTLRARAEFTTSGIHLLPPHEMLHSQLSMVRSGNLIHTSFAWLGYGALIRRSRAVEFLELLNHLDLTDEEFNMADNYFTILGNTFPEIWFDQSFELGGGQPFTVGTEGEERNNRHIIRAAAMLDSILSKYHASNDDLFPLPYVSTAEEPFPRSISRAPCVGSVCLLETSINLLPHSNNDLTAAAANILEVVEHRLKRLGEDERSHFLTFPPSHAVDGRRNTSFRSPENARKDDWVSLQVFRPLPLDTLQADIVFLIGNSTEAILRESVFEMSWDGISWIDLRGQINCIGRRILSSSDILRECHVEVSLPAPEAPVQVGNSRIFRSRLEEAVAAQWIIYEMRIEEGRLQAYH